MSKILIVDDETAIRTLLRSAVSSPALLVFEADGGARALEVAAEEAPFELVVTDILMPGMDGFQLAEEMKRAGHAARFLFISGYCDAAQVEERLKAFPTAVFLNKPFGIAEYLQAVRRLLAAAETASAEAQRRPA